PHVHGSDVGNPLRRRLPERAHHPPRIRRYRPHAGRHRRPTTLSNEEPTPDPSEGNDQPDTDSADGEGRQKRATSRRRLAVRWGHGGGGGGPPPPAAPRGQHHPEETPPPRSAPA